MNESPEFLSGDAGRLLGAAPLLACFDFQEHSGWRNNPDKTVGVTWDAWCSKCGFRLENKPWASGLSIEGNGRRLAHVVSLLRRGGDHKREANPPEHEPKMIPWHPLELGLRDRTTG